MSAESTLIDPLISYQLRLKHHIDTVAAGSNSSSFGCSDFYPSSPTTQQHPTTPPVFPAALGDDSSDYEDNEEDCQESPVRKKKVKKRGIRKQDKRGSLTKDQRRSSADSSARNKASTKNPRHSVEEFSPDSSSTSRRSASSHHELVTNSSSSSTNSSNSSTEPPESSEDEDELDVSPPTRKHRSTTTNPRLTTAEKESNMTNSTAALKRKVTNLENRQGELEEENQKLEEENDKLKEQMAELKAKYEAAMKKAKARGKRSKGGIVVEPPNSAVVTLVNSAVKKGLFRIIKFLADDEDLGVAVEKVCDMMRPDGTVFDEKMTDDAIADVEASRADWMKTYAPVVRQCLNNHRSYVQGQMRDQALLWQKGNVEAGIPAKTLPDPDLIWQVCCMRNMDFGGPEHKVRNEELFDWYVDSLLSCAAGAHHFSEKTRRTTRISEVLVPETLDKLAVPPSTEAVCFVIYENCYKKWIEHHIWKEVEKKTADVPKWSSKRPEETKRWKAKYSDNCSGQDLYGGWSDEGITAFNKAQKAIKRMRKDDQERIGPIEQACVDRLAAAHREKEEEKAKARGIDLAELERKRKKKGGNARKSAPKKKLKCVFDDDE